MKTIRSILEVKRWFEYKKFWVKTGIPMEVANNGKPIDELVIRHKDLFFIIDIDCESGLPTGHFCWCQDSPITHTSIRDFYTAVKDNK